MLEPFDWNLLRSFLAVLDAGSLSAASRASGISQPTLGRHVSELEKALGTTLFSRGRDGVTPTATALAIAADARRLGEAAGAISMLALGRTNEVGGTVRVTASEVVATYLLPGLLKPLLEETPGLEIELVATNTAENLLRRDADIAVRMFEPAQLDLIARKVADIHMGVFATREYLDKHDSIETPDDLRKHCVIGYDRDEQVIRGLKQVGLEVDRHFFRFRTDNQIAAWEACCAGVGIGFGPLYLARRRPELVRIGERFKIRPLPVWLVTHKELRTSARIRLVYDHLADTLAEALRPDV